MNNFKTKKLNDEREEKLQKKKELKKETRKLKNNNNRIINENPVLDLKESTENNVENKSLLESPEEKKETVLNDPILLHFNYSERDPKNCEITPPFSEISTDRNDLLGEPSDRVIYLPLPSDDKNVYENSELEEKEIGFIGPRLPRMMSDEEFQALLTRLHGDKNG